MKKWWYAFSTSPEIVPISPGVVLPTQGVVRTSPWLVRTSRRVVKGLHVTSGLTSEAVLSCWISRHLFWICPLPARIYVFISPKKHSPPSHRACFILIFSGFWCEGLDFKTFTRAVNAWRGGESKPSHRETASKSGSKRYKYERAVWIFEKAKLHTLFHWKSAGYSQCLKDWMIFLRIKNAYRRAWTGGQ